MSEFSNFTGSGARAGSSALQTTLPSSWYLQENIFELEREHIFFKEWICVGREEQVAEPGDHQVLDVYGESILLVRNGEGLLRAFYNVCRHRGARLCPAGVQEDSDDRLPLKGKMEYQSSVYFRLNWRARKPVYRTTPFRLNSSEK